MAKKWRSRYFNHLMAGADNNKMLPSKERKLRNKEFNSFISGLEEANKEQKAIHSFIGGLEGADKEQKAIKKQKAIVENFINETKDTGTPPLHIAAFIGNIKNIEILLKYGAKIEGLDSKENTILASTQDYKIAEYIISKRKVDINAKNKDGQSALTFIIEEVPANILSDNKKTNLAYLHIKNGAIIADEVKDNKIIQKATKRLFKEAIKKNDSKLVKQLIEQKAHTLKVNYSDFIGSSNLNQYAKKKASKEILQLIENAPKQDKSIKLPEPSSKADFDTKSVASQKLPIILKSRFTRGV